MRNVDVFEQGERLNAMLSGFVDGLVAIQSAISSLTAMQTQIMASLVDLVADSTAHLPLAVQEREMALRSLSAEIGAALRSSDRTAQARLSDAWDLAHRCPRTLDALTAGQITPGHATVIAREATKVTDPTARERVERHGIERAAIESPARLRAVLAPIAEVERDTGMVERHREARQDRHVSVRDIEDGMAELFAVLPSVLAHGIHDRLTSMSKHVKRAASGGVTFRPTGRDTDPELFDERCISSSTAGVSLHNGHSDDSSENPHATHGSDSVRSTSDDRTLSQIRADIFSDILLAGGPTAAGTGLDAVQAYVQVTVPVLTLAGIDEHGAELAGHGPIDPDTARQLAAGAPGWDRVMTHPISGVVLAVDRYRPSADIRRALRVRDERCRFPGCRQPAHQTDQDHSHDAALGGATDIGNLAHLCRRHHTLKHSSRWEVEQIGNGALRWTSPLGNVYLDVPPRSVAFSADAKHLPPG